MVWMAKKSYMQNMEQKIKRLIEEYKIRANNLSSILKSLSEEESTPENEINKVHTKLAKVLWNEVIKDLENIIR